MKKPINLTEFMVEEIMEEQFKKRPEICSCDKCKADIMAYALNQLPPRYVVTNKGEALTKAGILNSQVFTDLLVEVSKAIEKIADNPRHDA